MKHIYKTLFFSLLLLPSFSLFGLNTQEQNSSNQNWLKDQHDQTDVFAIPLDSSEEEEKSEEEMLENLQKKEASKQH